MSFRITAKAALAAAMLIAGLTTAGRAAVLVDNPFITSYNNWVDPLGAGDWRLHLGNGTLMESSDARPADGATNDGKYGPTVMVQDGYTTPSSYDLSARLYTSDDDLLGLIFGMQPNGDHFRVGMREQSVPTPGSLGGTVGLSVQKVVGGVITQISPNGTGPGNTLVPTQAMIDGRLPIDVTVSVDGANYKVYVAGLNDGNPLASGSDPDLMAGKIGVQSWAQRNDVSTSLWWGTEVDSISVSDNAGVLFSDTFENPYAWRDLYMANSAGLRTNATGVGDDVGNFGADFRNGWIYDRTNGFEWATEATPNVDFIGPAVVIDEAGSENFSDYEMRVRIGNADDDGVGVIVRAQDDDNFYRINFAKQSIDQANAWERAPQGLSVQKVKDGVWTELFRDDQNAPLFLFDDSGTGSDTPGAGLPVFDLSVKAIGNQLFVQVIEDPDGAANVINYPVITDASDPLLTGTVGFAKWGSEFTYYLPHGGGGAFLTEVPEPSSLCLGALALAGFALVARRRRK